MPNLNSTSSDVYFCFDFELFNNKLEKNIKQRFVLTKLYLIPFFLNWFLNIRINYIKNL